MVWVGFGLDRSFGGLGQRNWTRGQLWTALPFRIGTDEVTPAAVVRDLGIYIDSDVSMRSHVTKTVSACLTLLRQLRSIRRSAPRSVFQLLVTSLVLSRLDSGNATLAAVFRCPAGVPVVEVRPHHSAPSRTLLAEGGGKD